MQENIEKIEKKPSGVDEFIDWVESILFAIFIVILIFTFLFKQVSVVGQSMMPTLTGADTSNTNTVGDRVIISNLFYTPVAGDIIVANSEGLNEQIIKRVIATENQVVDIDFEQGKVYIDGVLQYEPYIQGITSDDEGAFTYPITVPSGHIFVMGDNRNNSTDSRSPIVGFISKKDILGKAILRIYPFKSFGGLYDK